MKILQIHNFYRYRGGEDRYVKILEETIRGNGHQVVHFFYDSLNIGSFSSIKKLMIPFRMINSPAAARELEQLIRKENPGLAVVHNLSPLLSPSVLKVLKRHNIPVLKRLENYKFLCLNGLFLRNNFKACEVCKNGNFIPGVIHRCYQRSFFSSLGMALAEYIHRRKRTVIKNSDLFLATSRFVKSRFLDAGFPEDKILVHPNFLDFDPVTAPGTPGPKEYAIYVGRLSREKGLLTLLKAFKNLPHLPLKILGEGPLEEEMKEFTRLHNMAHVSFEGFIDGQAKRDILEKALFSIFSSECYESFGYTIIESYACAVPVMASDMGGARELVTEGGTGYLFRPGDPQDLQKKIELLLSDRKRLETMKISALDRAKEHYTRETGSRSLAEVFQRLTGENKDPTP